MIGAYSDGYFGMMRDIGIGYQIAKDQRIKEREALLHQGNNEAALIAWEEREQHFPFPFSRGQITAYNAWKESKANGLEVVESRDLPWEKDFHDYIETFREARIESIIVTDSAFNKGKYAHLFENEGCRIIGQKVFIRHEKRSTGIENINAVGILITIFNENERAVDSDD